MTVLGEARTLHQRFKFIVEIDGVANTGFQSCSELSGEWSQTEYYEGGAIIPHKLPARLTFEDITLERGAVSGDQDLYDWWSQAADAASNGGQVSPTYKRNLEIVQLDRDNSAIRRWTVYNAWVKKFVPGQWDNTSDDPTIESVVLAYDYFELAPQA